MLTFSFRFLAGRYHATAWGSHVNEGVPEWPPSSWRLLRALLATAHHKAPAEIGGPRLRALIDQLAAAPPPSYSLPPATVAHTRHYFPTTGDKTTKVFDTFIAPGRGDLTQATAEDAELHVHWAVSLGPAEQELLATLLRHLGYLGRAESLVEARLVASSGQGPSTSPGGSSPTVRPLLPGEPLPPGATLVRLLSPVAPVEYATWAAPYAPAPAPVPAGKKPKKATATGKAARPPVVQPALFDALQVDTDVWRGAGWALPPGARWIDYARLAPPPRPLATRLRPHRAASRFDTARFALTAPVLPSIRALLPLTERLHDALVKHSDNSPVFSGIEQSGAPRSGHGHAYLLPECDPVRGFITHLTVYAADKFGDRERQALEAVRRLYGRESPVGIGLTLLALGTREEFPDLPAFQSARRWRSLTPFIATRHAKTFRDGRPKLDPNNGLPIGTPEHDLARLLAAAGLAPPTSISAIAYAPLTGRRLAWLDFVHRRRAGDGSHGHARPAGFEIEFPTAVPGPLALGYAAHFGLGLFVPAD